MNIVITPSDKTNKKIMAVKDNKNNNNNKKTIHFGDSRHSDYTIHKNEARKKAYLSRHKHDNYTNINYPSFYAAN